MVYVSCEFGCIMCDNCYIMNQIIFVDESIYKVNKGFFVFGDSCVFVEVEVQCYFKEVCGFFFWLGSDLIVGGSLKKYGSNYYQVMSKGLMCEWGYLGNVYGEMVYYIVDWYLIIGNLEFFQQVVKMVKVWVVFCCQLMIVNGVDYYCMMEVIGLFVWCGVDESDGEFEDVIVYGDSFEWMCGMWFVVVIGDFVLIGYVKQMFVDNQYFVLLIVDSCYYMVIDVLNVFVDYVIVKVIVDSGIWFFMIDGQLDFVWVDEENCIFVFKYGNDWFWIIFYWQVKIGIGINGIVCFYFSILIYD